MLVFAIINARMSLIQDLRYCIVSIFDKLFFGLISVSSWASSGHGCMSWLFTVKKRAVSCPPKITYRWGNDLLIYTKRNGERPVSDQVICLRFSHRITDI